MRRLAFPLLALLLALVCFAVATEVAVRVIEPTPRIQVVRTQDRSRSPERSIELTLVDGVPVWSSPWDRDNWRLDCPEKKGGGADRVLVFGDSILYGLSLKPNEVFTWKMEQQLLDARRASCVMNLAQPGFTFQNEWVLAEEHIPRVKPQLVFWEIWLNTPQEYTVIGDAAYRFATIATGEDGYPHTLGAPPALDRFLFEHSRAWEYATLALGGEDKGRNQREWSELVAAEMPRLKALVEENGGELVLVFVPPLDRPFPAQIASFRAHEVRERITAYDPAIAWAEANGVRYHLLWEDLADQDVAAIRLDTCCHYNAAGHEVLADIFTRWTLDVLAPEPEEAPEPSETP